MWKYKREYYYSIFQAKAKTFDKLMNFTKTDKLEKYFNYET